MKKFLINKLKSLNTQFYPQRLFYAPEWIVLGVNNICNLHCKMCDVGVKSKNTNFYQNLMGSSPLNMPLELIKKIITQSAKYFPNVKLGYAFTEPIIYPYLIESLQFAKKNKIYTTLTTNALTLNNVASDLVVSGLNEIFISLDGPPNIHNKIRGNNKSFEKAYEGIEKVLSHNKHPEISIFCVITEWNIGHLLEFIEIFKNLSIKKIGFMHTNFTDEKTAELHNLIYGKYYPATSSNMEEINIKNMKLELLQNEIEKIENTNYNFPIVFSPKLSSTKELNVFYYHPELLIGKRCHDTFRNIMIKSDGSVIPSHGRCYNITIGNIYKYNLKEIWNSAKISQFRKDLINAGGLLPACSRCCSAF